MPSFMTCALYRFSPDSDSVNGREETKRPVLRMKAKKICDLLVFILINIIVNGADVITDGWTVYALCKNRYINR